MYIYVQALCVYMYTDIFIQKLPNKINFQEAYGHLCVIKNWPFFLQWGLVKDKP